MKLSTFFILGACAFCLTASQDAKALVEEFLSKHSDAAGMEEKPVFTTGTLTLEYLGQHAGKNYFVGKLPPRKHAKARQECVAAWMSLVKFDDEADLTFVQEQLKHITTSSYYFWTDYINSQTNECFSAIHDSTHGPLPQPFSVDNGKGIALAFNSDSGTLFAGFAVTAEYPYVCVV